MIKAIPMEDWLRGCIYHDGRSGYVTLPTDKVHQIANYIQRTRRSGTDGLIDLEVVEVDRKTENSSEKPNNCEHITEDGVTCAKYPACDDCLDNPLNKVKGSERLVKGKDEPQTCETCKWGEWYRSGYDITMMDDECGGCCSWNNKWKPKDEPQTDCSWGQTE